MILYVNGDAHTAAAYAAVPYSCAEQDVDLWWMGAAPHPANQDVSYATHLAKILKARLVLDTETGGTVGQIIAGTKKFIGSNKFLEPILVIIGWPEITPEVAEYHEKLNIIKVPHIFFSITEHHQESFLIPEPYIKFCNAAGFHQKNEFFGPDAHQAWANHLIKYIVPILK